MKKITVTQAELHRLFDYSPKTGLLTRRISTGPRSRAGQVVGTVMGAGYLNVSISHEKFIVHRLIWLYVHGVWPPHDIDHINGVKTDNRLANLRLVTRSENQHNMRDRKNNSSGFIGVRRSASKDNYSARITLNGEERYLGSFPTALAAHAAYMAAKAVYHPTAPS
jgi:hypothetical protein